MTERMYGTRSEKIFWIKRAGGQMVGGRKLSSFYSGMVSKKSGSECVVYLTVGY